MIYNVLFLLNTPYIVTIHKSLENLQTKLILVTDEKVSQTT